MNLRLSILLVAVLLIFGGTFLVIRFTGSEEARVLRPWLYRIDEFSIVHITVTHQNQTVEYDRQSGSRDWYILGDPDIPVFIPKWGGTPLLVSGPRVSRSVAEEVEDPTVFGLEPPVTRLSVKDRSGNRLEILLGDPTPDAVEQYAQLVGDPGLFTVPISWAEVVNRLAIEPPYLRLYQLDDRPILFFEVSSGGQSIIYRNDPESGQWFIQGEPEVPVLQEKWAETPLLISGPRVEQNLADTIDNPAEYGLEPPIARVRIIQAGGGQPTEFHLGAETPDGNYRYARVLGQPELYAMPKPRAQRILELATNPPYPPGAEDRAPGSG